MDLFEISALPTDDDVLLSRLKHLLHTERDQIVDLSANYRNKYYPGESVLKDGKEAMEQLLNIQESASFYNKARELRQDLREYAIDSREVKSFFDNQKD